MFGMADYGVVCAVILLLLALPRAGNLALLAPTRRAGLHADTTTTMADRVFADVALSRLATAGVAAVLGARPLALEALQALGAASVGWTVLRLPWVRGAGTPSPVRSRPHHSLRQALPITQPKL